MPLEDGVLPAINCCVAWFRIGLKVKVFNQGDFPGDCSMHLPACLAGWLI